MINFWDPASKMAVMTFMINLFIWNCSLISLLFQLEETLDSWLAYLEGGGGGWVRGVSRPHHPLTQIFIFMGNFGYIW